MYCQPRPFSRGLSPFFPPRPENAPGWFRSEQPRCSTVPSATTMQNKSAVVVGFCNLLAIAFILLAILVDDWCVALPMG